MDDRDGNKVLQQCKIPGPLNVKLGIPKDILCQELSTLHWFNPKSLQSCIPDDPTIFYSSRSETLRKAVWRYNLNILHNILDKWMILENRSRSRLFLIRRAFDIMKCNLDNSVNTASESNRKRHNRERAAKWVRQREIRKLKEWREVRKGYPCAVIWI